MSKETIEKLREEFNTLMISEMFSYGSKQVYVEKEETFEWFISKFTSLIEEARKEIEDMSRDEVSGFKTTDEYCDIGFNDGLDAALDIKLFKK